MWNRCGFCKQEILPRKGEKPSATKRKQYCNHSCSAKANNANRYDWKAVQSYYDKGHSIKKCMDHFGFYPKTWQKAIERGDVVSRGSPPLLPLEELKSRGTVRKRIINQNLLPYKCSICGISKWRGKLLSLNLDHINGIADDHRLENLRWVCPNCDSQSSTFAGRNVKH